MVVIAVAVALTSLLMPAMRQLHENAHRVMCMSNLQQMAAGFVMYGHDHNDNLPYSAVLQSQPQAPQDLMATRIPIGWQGLGLLFARDYCSEAQCFYCPSHHGSHPFERYSERWERPWPGESIYSNYHFAGHVEWGSVPHPKKRKMLDGHKLVLATDGLRTASDFNHGTGFNVLRADGSVRWREDTRNIIDLLPKTETEPPQTSYNGLWEEIASTSDYD